MQLGHTIAFGFAAVLGNSALAESHTTLVPGDELNHVNA